MPGGYVIACCQEYGERIALGAVTIQLEAKKPGFFMPEALSSYEKLQLAGVDWPANG